MKNNNAPLHVAKLQLFSLTVKDETYNNINMAHAASRSTGNMRACSRGGGIATAQVPIQFHLWLLLHGAFLFKYYLCRAKDSSIPFMQHVKDYRKRGGIVIYRLLCLSVLALAALVNVPYANAVPVSWSVRFAEEGDDNAMLVFTADIAEGWVVYGLQLPDGGPRPTKVVVEECTGAKVSGPLHEITPYKENYDTLFELVLKSYSNRVSLALPVKIVSHPINISGYVVYQASNGKTCTPPTRHRFNINLPGETDIAEPALKVPAGIGNGGNTEKYGKTIHWNSAKDIIQQIGEDEQPKAITAVELLKRGFSNGLLALGFPSLWPIVLMTIYSFRKVRTSRRLLLIKIFSYDITLVILFPFVGLLITQLLGYDFLGQINGNIYFNIAMFLVFLWLSGYLFGVKGMKLPDKTPSSVRLLFLGAVVLILALSSTGRFIGQILKESETVEPITGPLILFFGFICAFVTVTTAISLVSNWNTATLESKTRLDTINRIAGFFILSYSLTFISDINLSYGYNIIGRDLFIAIWISIYAALGAYLLGAFSFMRDADTAPKITVKRLIAAISSFSFCLYMLPGLWGAPLSIINLVIPPSYTQEFSLYDDYKDNLFNDYSKGMSYAYTHKRPVLLTFSTVGDAESRMMEAMLWNFTPIKTVLNNEFAIIALKTDSKEVLPQSLRVSMDGKTTTVETYGELWSAFQQERFGSSTNPYQIILSPYGEPLSGALGYSDNAAEYLEFLLKALNRYKKQYDETEE